MKKTIFLALVVVSAVCMAIAGQAKEDAKIPDATLPITFHAYGNSYTVDKYEVTKDKKGKTQIVLIGSGFNAIRFGSGATSDLDHTVWSNTNPDDKGFPVLCSFISAGKEVNAVNFGLGHRIEETETGPIVKTSGIYLFETSADPEILVLYPGDNMSKKVRINVK